MKLNVAQELKQPGRIGKCHEDVILDRQEYLGRELKFAAPLTVEGEYFFDGEGFSFKGTATTRLDSECALCGKPFIEELTLTSTSAFSGSRSRTANATATPARNWMSARCSLTTYSSICLLSASAARIVRGFARFAGAI